MVLIGQFLLLLLNILFWVIIAQVVISWLIAFDVINVKNAKAQNLIVMLNKITDPIFKPLRKVIPSIGGIDITPIIVIFAISILQRFIATTFIYQQLGAM